ncbi:MAG: type IX secretion system membrane protein PorP/SprF, partial [Luteibaculum sp.]
GVRYKTLTGLEITPHAQFMYQDGFYNGIIGTNFSYALIDTETRLEGGLSYRVGDAIIPYVGMLYKDFLFGVSFDTNVSSLSDVGNFKNAVEFSLTYTNRKNKYRQEFICPRL